MKTYSLVHIGRDTFLMLNAEEIIKDLDLKVHIIIDKLDRRTKRFKKFENDFQYFSVSFLPKIKERVLNNSLTFYKF